MTLLEIAVDSVQCGLYAQAAGADRLEVCSRLDRGGCSPTGQMFADLRRQVSIPLFPMIRPRDGAFVYTAEELNSMVEEILALKDGGANGFVFGPLSKASTVDTEAVDRLMAAADPLPCTFHRAFDRTKDRSGSLVILKRIGIDRILTSGGAESAEEGIGQIAEDVRGAASDLIIMPGGGVRPSNIERIVRETRVREIHSSGRGGEPRVDPVIVKRMRSLLDAMPSQQ